MYTLCRSQFLPCVLIMAALTAGIFMLFYCLRKKPMWVTACVLLLIVGSWVSGTIAGRHENADGGFMNFLFTASASFDIVFAAASIFMFSSIIGFIGFYFSVDSPRPCFLLLLSFIPLILSSRTMRELPVYFMLIMTGCFIFASANLSVPCFPGVKNFEGKHTRLRRAMPAALACVLSSLLFGVLHGQLLWIAYAFVMGVALTIVFERTGTLWANIIVHITFNLAGSYLVQYLPGSVFILVLGLAGMAAAWNWLTHIYPRV